jgi:hypothetical protein
MPATGFEIAGSRRVTNNTAERQYRLTGATDEQDVVDFVAGLPATVAGFPFGDFNAEELEEEGGGGDYDLSVLWTPQPLTPIGQGESGTLEYRFNFQAPSAKINQSLSTISVTAASGYPADKLNFGGAINVVFDEEGKKRVEGVDLPVPPEVFQLLYYAPNAVVDGAYQSLVQSLCGKVNSATFRGYAAGQIMLVRVNGQTRNNSDWTLDFGFGYVPNATSIPVGPDIVVSAKDGFDLLWPFYDHVKDDDAKDLLPRPVGALVERVYERADLTALNLPA